MWTGRAGGRRRRSEGEDRGWLRRGFERKTQSVDDVLHQQCVGPLLAPPHTAHSPPTEEVQGRRVDLDDDVVRTRLWLRCLVGVASGKLVERLDVRVHYVALHGGRAALSLGWLECGEVDGGGARERDEVVWC